MGRDRIPNKLGLHEIEELTVALETGATRPEIVKMMYPGVVVADGCILDALFDLGVTYGKRAVPKNARRRRPS